MEKHVNIYDKQMFPNPPIVPLTLYPLMVLPESVGPLVWFGLKAALAAISALLCFRMARQSGSKVPAWAEGLTLLLCLRPILSDLEHGNNNLIILSLVVATLYAWRKGFDVLAGLTLALAITYKVTPALFVPYFMYKGSWRTVTASLLGVGIFLLIVPSLFLSQAFNAECLTMWWHRILSPYIVAGEPGVPEINQSMVGVLTRLLTKGKVAEGRYDLIFHNLNLLDLDRRLVVTIIKGISVALVGLLAVFCRTKAERRDDHRWLGEFSLVVLTMLFVSERSWKHHYVTLMLPFAYLAFRLGSSAITGRARKVIAGCLALSALLMATTSTEMGGLFAAHQGHKIAQFYGMFFWAGVVVYAATAWRVRVEGRRTSSALPPDRRVAGRHATHRRASSTPSSAN